MNKIIRAQKVFEYRANKMNNSRVFYCIECINRNDVLGKSQLISIYDLDNDGVLRVGFPTNPYTRNMFFGPINECDFCDQETIDRLIKEGKRPVQTSYYHAFSTKDEIDELGFTGRVLKVIMDNDTQKVIHYADYTCASIETISRKARMRK